MATMEELNEVLSANRDILRRARSLNELAGREVFVVPSVEQLVALAKECLQGARTVGEISRVECLRLDPLDKAKEREVLKDWPETIELIGQDREVEYGTLGAPTVVFNRDEVARGVWKDLPDEGVFLPNKTPVHIRLICGTGLVSGADVPELKLRVQETLNNAQWNSFEKPEISVPDLLDTETNVPDVLTVQYGNCVLTGEPLRAYGTVAVARLSWKEDSFHVVWTFDMMEAYTLNDAAKRSLAAIRREKAQEIVRKRDHERAQVVQKELVQLRNKHVNDVLIPKKLRERLEVLAYELFGEWSSQDFVQKAQQFKAQLEPAVKKAEAQRESERKALEFAEARDMELYGVSGNKLSTARALAERALEGCDPDEAEMLFMEELTAPYGHDQRQATIREKLGNGGATSVFYSLNTAADVDAVLNAAMTLVNEVKAKAAQSAKPQVPAVPIVDQLFGGRAIASKKKGRGRGKRR